MKLSDFKDDEAFKVVGKLIAPIAAITTNMKGKSFTGSMAEYVGEMLLENTDECKRIFAILNNLDVEDYHPTAASLFADIVNMLADQELLRLFGVQGQTQVASGSATDDTAA